MALGLGNSLAHHAGSGATPLPLDAQTGAFMAYSLRNLSEAFSGPVIHVEGVSGTRNGSVRDVTAAELLGGEFETWCSGDSSCVVDTIYDQSGNGRDAIQSTIANCPLITNTSGVIYLLNGLPAMSFDGADDYLITSGSFSPNDWRALVSATYYHGLFSVGLDNNTGDATHRLLHNNNAFHALSVELRNSSNIVRAAGGYLFSYATCGYPGGAGAWFGAAHAFAFFTDEPSGSQLIFVDGADQLASDAPEGSRANAAAISYGSNSGSDACAGLQQEMILFAADVTETQAAIQAEQMSYYGI